MTRSDESIGQKWNDAYKQAIPDAQEAYGDSLATAATNLKAKKTVMKDKYEKALDSADYNASVDAAFTPGVAGTAYEERTDQIAVTGLTPSQVAKVVANVKIVRHLQTLIEPIRNVLNTQTKVGDPQFAYDYTDGTERLFINIFLLKKANGFGSTTTAQQVLAKIKAQMGDLFWVEAKS